MWLNRGRTIQTSSYCVEESHLGLLKALFKMPSGFFFLSVLIEHKFSEVFFFSVAMRISHSVLVFSKN